MKQLIVLIAFVLLGVIIGGIVLDFSDDAEDLAGKASSGISSIQEQYDGVLGGGD